MSTALKIAGVTLALFLIMGTASMAQDDQPSTHGGPIVGDDTPIPPPATHGGGPLVGGDKPLDQPGEGGGDTNPKTPPTRHPTESGGNFPMVDTVPTGDASCFFFHGWEMDGEVLDGAYLTNTGDTVIKSGSIVYFTMGGQTISMVVPFDVSPGGTWGYFVGNYSYQPLVFPTGTSVPAGGECNIQIAFA